MMNRFVTMNLEFVLLAMPVLAGSQAAAADKPPVVGDQAKDFELSSLGGDKVKLSQLTADGPVVLVVLRGYPGYQCPLCTRQFGEFLARAATFRQTGAKVVFVYPGPAQSLQARAGDFVRGKDIPGHFYVLLDPDYIFTNAYGLRWNAKNETAYPSTFVLDRNRRVKFAMTSKTHGGRANAEEALKAAASK